MEEERVRLERGREERTREGEEGGADGRVIKERVNG